MPLAPSGLADREAARKGTAPAPRASAMAWVLRSCELPWTDDSAAAVGRTPPGEISDADRGCSDRPAARRPRPRPGRPWACADALAASLPQAYGWVAAFLPARQGRDDPLGIAATVPGNAGHRPAGWSPEPPRGIRRNCAGRRRARPSDRAARGRRMPRSSPPRRRSPAPGPRPTQDARRAASPRSRPCPRQRLGQARLMMGRTQPRRRLAGGHAADDQHQEGQGRP